MAVEIFKLFGSIFVNNDEANKSISETDKKSKGVASTLGNGIKTAAKWGTSLVAGAAAGVGALSAVAENTREYRTEMGKLDTAFTTNQFTADEAKKTYSDLYSILGDSGQATEAANHLSLLCNSTEDLQKWTDICTGVYAQFGDSLPIEGLTEAANETAKTGAVTGSLADALNWMGVSEDDFNAKLAECSSEQERQQLITSTLTGLYSDASAQYKETNSDVIESNRAHQQLSDTLAKIGEIAEPVLNSLIGLGGKLLEQLSPLLESVANELAPILINLAEQISPIIISTLEQIMPLIEQIIPFIAQLMEQLAPLIIQIVEAFFPPLIQIIEVLLPALMQIIQAMMPLISTVFQLVQPFIDLILQLLEPFAQLISNAIAPLISHLATLLNDLLQPLIPVFTEVAQIIGDVLAPVFETLCPIFNLVSNALNPIFELLSMLLNSILPAITPIISVLADVFSNVLGSALKAVSGIIENLTQIFQGIIDFITGVFSGNWEQAWSGIVEIFKGVFNLIPTIVEFIINGAIGLINGLLDGINWAIEWIGWEIPHIPEVTLPRFRAGIDYVPNDKYLAYLDAGEAVLNAQEAEQYRKAKSENNNPFSNSNKVINNNFNISISDVVIRDDRDIDEIVKVISEKLAAEYSKKASVFV